MITTFCKLDGVLEMPDLDGGPKGGNGLADKDTLVGLVIADDALLPPLVELRSEPTEDGLERDPDPEAEPELLDPKEVCFEARAALVTCLDVPCELGSDV